MPLEEYVANYDSILEDKPFKFGNMKGKTLNKSKFFNDYSDYEILLRNEVPEKYNKYFDDLSNNDNDNEIEIEIGRSNKNPLNLSPIKNNLDNGFKDSQVLSKKESKLENFSNNLENLYNDNDNIKNNNGNKSKINFKLDLGDLNLNKNENKNKTNNSNINSNIEINDLDNLDDLYEKTFKLLNKNSIIDNEGKQLNKMIQTLLDNMKSIKSENKKLNNNANDLKLIIKDLNSLITNYKLKLKSYYKENKHLKNVIEQQQYGERRNIKINNNDNIKNVKNNESFDEIDNDVDSIDRQIQLLQIKKRKLLERTNRQTQNSLPSIDDLSKDIMEKIMKQLNDHNNKNQKSIHDNDVDHENCPFCTSNSKDSNILLSKVLNSNSDINLDEFIELLADRFKFKMDINNNTNPLPDVW